MILWEIININKIINLNLCKIISLRYYLPKLTLHIKKLNKKNLSSYRDKITYLRKIRRKSGKTKNLQKKKKKSKKKEKFNK